MAHFRRFVINCAAVGALIASGLVAWSSGLSWRAGGDLLVASAAAQEEPEDNDDDDDDDDSGGDGVGEEDLGNDGVDDEDGGGVDDDGGGVDDDGGGDDDGPGGGDDDGPGGGDDDGPGGGDDDGPGGGDDDGPGGGDDGPGGGDDDDDGARGNRRGSDDDPPGGAGVRGVEAGGGLSIRDGDDDTDRLSEPPEGVEVDGDGRWVRAGELLALEIDQRSLDLARSLGFEVTERFRLATLGETVVRLRAPSGMSAREALRALREADPGTAYDFNHLYFPMRAQSAPQAPRAQRQGGGGGRAGAGFTFGMVDSAVAVGHPALRAARIESRDFVSGAQSRPTDHGTAVASLLVGQDGRTFVGAAPGARLLAASVVGRGAKHQLASVDGLVRALDWLSGENAPVINISLAGPPNALLERAVRGTLSRGAIIVAAVGNDGPAAPALYPAAYGGVVGVTAVDRKGAIYRRAGRGAQVDIAALGVGVRAATANGGYDEVAGTSFAAPLVAAWLAGRHSRPDPNRANVLFAELARQARDAGDPGIDPVYGAGILPTSSPGQ